MAIYKIGLDAGHGLKTAGKQTPDGIKEWTLNDSVADMVEEMLKEYNVEIIRLDNNEGNTDESLSKRYQSYIKAGVNLMVSIHHNALKSTWSSATGVEVFTDKNPTKEDSRLAELIYKKLVSYTGLKGRGVKRENWYVINQNKIPAVLCEGGFMDGTNDYKIITSKTGQKAYAKAVAEGIVEFLELSKTTAEKRIDVIYQAWDSVHKKWLPNVKNCEDYAGILGNGICCVFANLSHGDITYKVHYKGGKWLPEVKNRSDYAGIFGRVMDGVMMKTNLGKTIKYRVHLRKSQRWLPWVTGYDSNDPNNGFAGILGQEIDGIQVEVV